MTTRTWSYEADGTATLNVGEHKWTVLWNGKDWRATRGGPDGFHALGLGFATPSEAQIECQDNARHLYR